MYCFAFITGEIIIHWFPNKKSETRFLVEVGENMAMC